jgi:YbbR domain-containing protein
MLNSLRKFIRLLPILLTAFILALAVWISAVTANDPIVEKTYPTSVPVEVIGQDSNLIVTSPMPASVSLVLSAPQSIWNLPLTETDAVRAVVDLSGLEPGTHTLPIQVQIVPRPVRKVVQSPLNVTLTLERLAVKELPVNLVTRGSPAIGYLAGVPVISPVMVTVTGPATQVDRVTRVRATLDINQANQTINRTIGLVALDANEAAVTGVTIVPQEVTVSQEISQRFGYRNVVVKVVVTGQVSNGYRLTNISVFPPAVTVFSADPQVVSDLPGFVETVPLDISGAKDDLDVSLALDLPDGVSVVGDQVEVLVRVGIAAIESSLTLPNVPVEVTGLQPGLRATVSPENVTVIISGPVALLDRLKATDVRVVVNLSQFIAGTYQVEPEIEILIPELSAESVLPETIEVTITRGTPVPTIRPTP